MATISCVDKVVLSMAELAAVMGIGRSKAYELAHQSGFPMVRLGRRVVIPVEALKAWLEKQANNDIGL